MRFFTVFFCLSLLSLSSMAKSGDTIRVERNTLEMKSLQKGEYGYIIYTRKTKDGPSARAVLVKMIVQEQEYHSKPAIIVRQIWERDTTIHTAYSVFDAKDFSTILHDSWWKALGYSMKFDFEAKKAEYKNVDLKAGVPDSVIAKGTADFNQSFEKYNLNWHDDLIVYTLLPYRDNRSFVINYYDPGFGKAEEVTYSVTGSEMLTGHNGEKIDCWVLNHNDRDDPGGYERFWIAKRTREVMKEEDFGKRGFRFKLKLGISGD